MLLYNSWSNTLAEEFTMQKTSLGPEALRVITRTIRHASGWWLTLNNDVTLDDDLWTYVEYHGVAMMSIVSADGQPEQFGPRFDGMLRSLQQSGQARARRALEAFGTRDPATWFSTLRSTNYEGWQVVLNPAVTMSDETWAHCVTIVSGTMVALSLQQASRNLLGTEVAGILNHLAENADLSEIKSALQALSKLDPATWFINL